jgi:hypothetical protein
VFDSYGANASFTVTRQVNIAAVLASFFADLRTQ